MTTGTTTKGNSQEIQVRHKRKKKTTTLEFQIYHVLLIEGEDSPSPDSNLWPGREKKAGEISQNRFMQRQDIEGAKLQSWRRQSRELTCK